MFLIKMDRLRDLRLEGEASRTIPPNQRLKDAFEFLDFSEALYQAGKENVGDSKDEAWGNASMCIQIF